MHWFRMGVLAAAVLTAAPALAQDWAEFISKEDGFSAVFPGDPKVETITWPSEYRMTFPGRVYTASDPMGRYSTTVIDYRNAEKMHRARVDACRAAKGEKGLDGDSCQFDFAVEVAGAVNYATAKIFQRPNTRISHFMLYFLEMVTGNLVQLENTGNGDRTFAAVHMHDGRLYIHEATVAKGMPEPILFMQGLGFVDPEGRSIRYRTLYTEGYGEWQFPRPTPPARTIRGLDGSPVRP